ncbi:peptidoglycan-binding domain-containing protein [Phytoactinopolyspora halophila]|nr:peptidoglycan-binding domain-containing protein [Phytoactinopolyspora halophila]
MSTLILRFRRRWMLVTGVLLVALVVAFAAAGFGGGEPSTTASSGDGLPPATAEITTETLTQTQHIDGILSHGEPEPLIVQATSGVVTWIAAPGTILEEGEAVYEVDGTPVILVHGSEPPHRTLDVQTVGSDVEQFESSLADLGYEGFDVDDTYNEDTATAVEAWQEDSGLDPTGEVPPGQIAVVEHDIRIALHGLDIGSRLGAELNQTVLTYSGTKKLVSVPLDVDKQQYVAEGDSGTVTLPDGTTVEGTVTYVAAATQEIEGEGGGEFIPVEVSIENQETLDGYNAAPVTLDIVTGEATDVHSVPVTALVALGGGGYGLEVLENGETSYVHVETGMFADGMVEISGPGISEGMTVGVAE